MTPFWLVYTLLLVNTAVCFWRRWSILTRDIAVRRYATLGSYLFHGSFFLIAAGFLLSMATREDARVWVAVGEDFTQQPEQYLSADIGRLAWFGPPGRPFRVDAIRPAFWRDELLFTELAADVVFEGDVRHETRINRPIWIGPATFLRMSGFGYAPRWELINDRGEVTDSAFAKLNVFPPGQQDGFTVPGLPHRFQVEVLPDHAVEGGSSITRGLNLANPAVVVRVTRGRLDLGGDVLETDESFGFEGLGIRFPEIRYWGEFSIVRDPGVPVLFLGYLVGIVGLLVKLVSPGGRPTSAEH